jgi:HSP20 family protein
MLPVVYTNGTTRNRLASLFDTFFNDNAPEASSGLALWEDEQNAYVELDAPGVSENDVELHIHQGELFIQAERKRERQAGYDNRNYGKFKQRIALPCPVDTDKVQAKLVNGVLSITCPKSESAKPRRITLKSE